MPEVLHTLTKPGGLRLVPKAGRTLVVFPTGWNGNKPFPWAILDSDITPTSIINVEYTPRLTLDKNNKILEAADDWEMDTIQVRVLNTVAGSADIQLLAPKQRLVGIKTITYYIYEP
jgi:hypothetical protein